MPSFQLPTSHSPRNHNETRRDERKRPNSPQPSFLPSSSTTQVQLFHLPQHNPSFLPSSTSRLSSCSTSLPLIRLEPAIVLADIHLSSSRTRSSSSDGLQPPRLSRRVRSAQTRSYDSQMSRMSWSMDALSCVLLLKMRLRLEGGGLRTRWVGWVLLMVGRGRRTEPFCC